MNILGVSWLSDASAAIVVDGRLICALSEERLNRKKNWYGFPEQAIARVLDMAGMSLGDIDLVATHGAAPSTPATAPFQAKERAIAASDLPEAIKNRQLEALRRRHDHERMVLGERTPGMLAKARALARPLLVHGHHEAHAACAYFGSGWDACLALTADGWGEDGSSTLWRADENRLELLSRSETIDSLGYFYGSVTKALGFIPHRHEGKVLGLAAYSQAPRSFPHIRSMIDYDVEGDRFVGRMENGIYIPHFENPALDDIIREYDREDIASATQRSLEEVVTAMVAAQGDAARRIALAGGIFANVKLNQRIAELENVEEVYVFPHMGDGGLAVGAAWLAYAGETGAAPAPATTMYLGPSFDDGEIAGCLSEGGARYKYFEGISGAIAELLAKGEPVMRFNGGMEFGPRALGHRSILVQATDPSINQSLNERLDRSEFMPFAPATLEDEAEDLYRNLHAGRGPARFMAMTFDCSPRMRAEAPAAVHVDGTARPQVVSAEDYPDFHAILSAYRDLTGLASVINTSFNMHEEPIVCTPEDALRAFFASGMPYLAIGGCLVEK